MAATTMGKTVCVSVAWHTMRMRMRRGELAKFVRKSMCIIYLMNKIGVSPAIKFIHSAD